MHFKFTSIPEIHFGRSKVKSLPNLIKNYGNKALLITGNASFLKSNIAIELFQDLEYLEIITEIVRIKGEPSPSQIDEVVQQYKSFGPNVVVAVGGGSVMDAGKAISAMLCEKNSVINYLEGVGTMLPSGSKVPLIAIPTTSGTGSEATKNAVLTKLGKDGFKKSLRHDNYIPTIALIDPELTLGCPPTVTAASGMDAFTQLLESYLSTNSSPLTDALAMDGMRCIIRSLKKVVQNGQDIEARKDISYAALLSGITLANAGLGVVHGFAQPLGSIFAVPHGIVCGTLMGSANRITVQKLRSEKKTVVLEKYYNVAQLVSESSNMNVAIDEFLDYLDQLIMEFKLPKLSNYGISNSDFDAIVVKTGLKFHPIDLSEKDLRSILEERL